MGIADPGYVAKSIASEKLCGGRFLAHVHEDNMRSCRLNSAALFGNVGKCFPAKGASGMPEENQQYRGGAG
jgi:hypothetical protein